MQNNQSLKSLTDAELISRLCQLSKNERVLTVAVLDHLIELDDRRLYLEAGYSSLFDFCRRRLRYSEGAAQRRIVAARCIKDKPELKELLLEGKVSLCTIATAAGSLRQNVTQVEEIIDKSKKEVELLVAKSNPQAKPREALRPIVTREKSLSQPTIMPLTTPVQPKEEIKEERYEMKFSVSKETYDKFMKVRAKASHALGKDLSIEAVFTRLIEAELREVKPRASVKSLDTSRYIPAQLRSDIFKQDKAQCSYVAADGTRCTETHYLEVDHVKPFGIGGKTEPGNVRVLCSMHNLLLAKKTYGDDFILGRINR